MADRQVGWERLLAVALILVTLVVLTWIADFSNADISFPALATAMLVLVMGAAGKHDAPE